MNSTLEKQISLEGMAIFSAIKNSKESMFDKHYWLGRMMEWVMKDPSFKVDLFRFVDVLPALNTNEQISEHIKEYLIDRHRDIPLFLGTALKATSFSLTKGLAAAAIRKNVTDMAERFILGTNIKKAATGLTKLKEQGFSFTIDLLGEKALSDFECEAYASRYRDIIEALPSIGTYKSGDVPNISIKVSSLAVNLREEDPRFSVEEAKRRVWPLLRLAKEKGVFVNFDLETWATHEIVCQLFNEILTSDEFFSWPHLGIVVQAYLKESGTHLKSLIDLCRMRKTPITVRLVKGAYWDYEVIKAEQLGISCPVFREKAQTDLNYEALSRLLIDHAQVIIPAFGSHNIRSLAQSIAYAKEQGLSKEHYEIQMLYGMANAEKKALLDGGHHVRLYVPIGEMIPGMSYLVRRLLENTSQMGFIKIREHDHMAEEALLKRPEIEEKSAPAKKPDSFVNEPMLDFTEANVREHFRDEIEKVSSLLPMRVPVMIEGNKTPCDHHIERLSPNDPQKLIALVDMADNAQADLAVKLSLQAFLDFKDSSLNERVACLYELASILKKDLYYIAAIICHEVGKTWAEAVADAAEAIDYCRYYAWQAENELHEQQLSIISGQDNRLYYQGRGPTVIIAPWNFPIAILGGMSVAAYVAGNPIIMKPAEASSLTAYVLYERMIAAGFNKKACHFLPGSGEQIGAHLVSHPDIANICFTGSMAVGHKIIKAANSVTSEQRQMKRVICEMGGKNAIIIDDDADLDEAVAAIIKSAFLFAGQKCSAASRIIIVGAIKKLAIERLIAACKSMV
ncbi:MAG TPA: proline dehydrogenase family protein, partial [Myxococcota bacterium]|nr:proline dehydrogenase family protein [Myxococcota bacterium]